MMGPPQPERLLTASEASWFSGFSYDHFIHLVYNGGVPVAMRRGRRYYFQKKVVTGLKARLKAERRKSRRDKECKQQKPRGK